MRPPPHVVAVALAGSVALSAPIRAAGADGELALDAELATGLDSNPERALRGGGPPDGFVSALLRGRWRVAGERFGLSAQLAEAGRLYATSDATAVGSRLDAGAQVRAAERVAVAVTLLASDLTERGHRLDQDALDALGSVVWSPAPWRLHAGAGWAVFSPRDAPLRPFLSSGARAVAGAAFDLTPGDTLSGGYELATPSYPRWSDLTGSSRDDRAHTFSAELAHRGAFVAAAGYAYTRNRSTAAGGAFDRHRVHARLAAYLWDDVSVAARAALQWSSYPQALFLAEQLLLAEGQQNLDAFEVRVTRPLGAALELAIALAVYRAEAAVAPGDVPSFTRVVGSVGIGWRGTLTGDR